MIYDKTLALTTENMTMEEAHLLHDTSDDFLIHGKTDVKCPRCGGKIVLTEYGTSYTIGCEDHCVKLAYRGL